MVIRTTTCQSGEARKGHVLRCIDPALSESRGPVGPDEKVHAGVGILYFTGAWTGQKSARSGDIQTVDPLSHQGIQHSPPSEHGKSHRLGPIIIQVRFRLEEHPDKRPLTCIRAGEPYYRELNPEVA